MTNHQRKILLITVSKKKESLIPNLKKIESQNFPLRKQTNKWKKKKIHYEKMPEDGWGWWRKEKKVQIKILFVYLLAPFVVHAVPTWKKNLQQTSNRLLPLQTKPKKKKFVLLVTKNGVKSFKNKMVVGWPEVDTNNRSDYQWKTRSFHFSGCHRNTFAWFNREIISYLINVR